MSKFKIQGETGDLTSKLVLMNQQLAKIVENTKRATEASKEHSESVKTGVAGMIQKLANFITMQKSNETFDATKNLQAQWGAVTGAISGGLAVLTMFKDELMKVEKVATEKTALKLLSQQGEDLNVTLAKTRDITHGVAKGTEILETVNKLLLKGFKLTGESLTQLIDISGIYSSTTGEDMNSIMMRIATASQRESEKMFEKMGIYIDVQYELDKYAKKVGTTADRLDEATKSNVLFIASMREQKKFLDEKGLTNTSLESPVTWQYQKAADYIATVKKELFQGVIDLYLAAIPIFEDWFQSISDYNDRMVALFSQGWDAYNAVSKQQADKRYNIQQISLVEANRLFEENKIKESDIFKKYSDQQAAYGITNKETVWKTYNELMDKLKKESSTSTLFVSYKLFDIDPMRDKRNLAAEMFFTTKEFEDYLKIGQDAYKKYYDELKKIRDEKLKIENSIEEMALDDKVKVEELKYNRLFDEFEAFSNKKVKHTEKYHAELALLEVKVAQQAMILEKAQNEKKIKDEKDSNDYLIWLKKDQFDSEIDLMKQKKDFDKQVLQDEVNGLKDYKAFRNKYDTDFKISSEELTKMTKEELDARLEVEQSFEDRKAEMKQKGIDIVNNVAMAGYESLIAGEGLKLKEMASMAMKQAGSAIFNDGLQGLWIGGRHMLSPFPTVAAQGATEVGYSLAEMGAGIALGYAGSKLAPKTSKGADRDESAKDKNELNKDNKQTSKVNTYLFPSDRQWMQTLQASNARLNG